MLPGSAVQEHDYKSWMACSPNYTSDFKSDYFLLLLLHRIYSGEEVLSGQTVW